MKQDIIKVFGTNLIKMGVAFFATFLLPAVLSVDSYANVKLYQLYVSYIGFFHLGYCDGIYLKYGGLDFKDNIYEIKNDLHNLQIFQFVISILVVLISILRKDWILFAFGITILPRNVRSFFEYAYQATGRFREYAKVVNGYSTLTIIFYFVLIVVLDIKDYRVYIAAFLLIDLLTYFWGKFLFAKEISLIKRESIRNNTWFLNVKYGFFLMLGNFANTLFLSIDKWFVKVYMGMEYFAYYSFATQILLMITMFITPVTMTLYNYLSCEKNNQFEINIRKHLTSIVFIMLSFSFLVDFVVRNFLPNYKNSIPLIYILFLSQIFSSINTAIFVNLFKVYKMQKKYFINLCVIIGISFICNFSFYFIRKNMESFAYATLFSMILNLFLNMRCFMHLKFESNEIAMMIIVIFLYMFLWQLNLPLIGFILFVVLYCFSLCFVRRKEWTYWISQINQIFHKFLE